MIPKVREGILAVEETLSLEDEESLNEDEKAESESTVDTGYQSEDSKDNNSYNFMFPKACGRRLSK